MHVFEGPYVITKLLGHSAYELRDESGKLRGEFNKKQLQQYQEAEAETQIQEWGEVVTTDAKTNHKLKQESKPLINRCWEFTNWVKIIIVQGLEKW